MPELGLTAAALIPYSVFSAAIAAVILGLRTAFPKLKEMKWLSALLPLILGGLGGWMMPDIHPKGSTESLTILYGIIAGSFSPPIYHACRRLVAERLKGSSSKPNAGYETTFDTSDPKLAKVQKPEKNSASKDQRYTKS